MAVPEIDHQIELCRLLDRADQSGFAPFRIFRRRSRPYAEATAPTSLRMAEHTGAGRAQVLYA